MAKDSKNKDKNENKYQELEEKLTKAEEQLKHALADYQNLQRQHERQKQALMDTVRKDIFKDLIDLFTDLNIATRKIDEVDESNPWMTGILQIMQKYNDLLKRHGVEEITYQEGDSIDYNTAQVIGTTPGGTTNAVAQMAEPGYKTGDFIIAPAKVIMYTGQTDKTTVDDSGEKREEDNNSSSSSHNGKEKEV